MKVQSGSSLWHRPSTRLGKWAAILTAVYLLLSVINNTVFMRLPVNTAWQQVLLPLYGIFMLLSGLAAGVVGLIAVIRQHERSWQVWLAIAAGVFVLLFILAEFLLPH